jgi:hypothetical protein
VCTFSADKTLEQIQIFVRKISASWTVEEDSYASLAEASDSGKLFLYMLDKGQPDPPTLFLLHHVKQGAELDATLSLL